MKPLLFSLIITGSLLAAPTTNMTLSFTPVPRMVSLSDSSSQILISSQKTTTKIPTYKKHSSKHWITVIFGIILIVLLLFLVVLLFLPLI